MYRQYKSDMSESDYTDSEYVLTPPAPKPKSARKSRKIAEVASIFGGLETKKRIKKRSLRKQQERKHQQQNEIMKKLQSLKNVVCYP